MKEEIRIFFTALMFYTRIPCPSWVDHSEDYINRATRYFPLIGWIVGGISFGIFSLGWFLFDTSVAVLMSIVAGILTTGAFHEDGLGDVVDGFGGGWTKERILDIMKDSRIGAFGAIALMLVVLMKCAALYQLSIGGMTPLKWLYLGLIFLSYHSLPRLTAINLVFWGTYSRDDATSKVKPVAKSHGLTEVLGAYFWGLLPLIGLMCLNFYTVVVIVPLFVLYAWSKKYFERWIDGYTGDCLGAVEQIGELVVLLTYVSIWKFM